MSFFVTIYNRDLLLMQKKSEYVRVVNTLTLSGLVIKYTNLVPVQSITLSCVTIMCNQTPFHDWKETNKR